MNSKELKEQSRENIKKQTELIDRIETAERAIERLQLFDIGLYVNGTYINSVVMPVKIEELNVIITEAVKEFLIIKQSELKQLLGLAPVVSPLTTGKILAVEEGKAISQYITPDTPEVIIPDPLAEKLTEILHNEADRIEKPAEKFEVDSITAEDKSLSTYPAKGKKHSGYPEGMTKDVVSEMYLDKGMTINAIAKHFGIPYAKASNFITKYNLARSHNKKPDKPDKQPEETERP